MVKRELGRGLAEGTDGLEYEWKTTLPGGVTREPLYFSPFCRLGLLSLGVFLLRPKTPVGVLLLGGARLILAPPRGAMVLVVDLRLEPLFGGGMVASGFMVNSLASSTTYSLASRC